MKLNLMKNIYCKIFNYFVVVMSSSLFTAVYAVLFKLNPFGILAVKEQLRVLPRFLNTLKTL